MIKLGCSFSCGQCTQIYIYEVFNIRSWSCGM
uniref:Uncharacterized protein n=1 Tax=Rhizophora mucronata TaxID=61149 RepID=A0A2P2LPY1_RHIMU